MPLGTDMHISGIRWHGNSSSHFLPWSCCGHDCRRPRQSAESALGITLRCNSLKPATLWCISVIVIVAVNPQCGTKIMYCIEDDFLGSDACSFPCTGFGFFWHSCVMWIGQCWRLCGREARRPVSSSLHREGDVLVPDQWEDVQGSKNGSHHVVQVSTAAAAVDNY